MNTNLERIIAKIENDFNPDNSDWIPRVAAWTIDAMAQLKVFNTIKKQRIKSKLVFSKIDITFYICCNKFVEFKSCNVGV